MPKRIYTEEEVEKATLKYFNKDELATNVWMSKYALKNTEGEYLELTPDDMHKRLAKELARIEMKYPNAMSEEEIYELLKGFRYIVLQGSPMSSIGNPYQLQSSGNCFVIEPPYDSYGGILKSDQELAQLMKRRAGVGVSIDNIRPKGVPTKNAAITTDGIEVFVERFSNTCREVAQNGRRGALLECLTVHHPDIKTFINIKRDLRKVTGANISVKLTDEFMNAVKGNEEYELRWPIDSKNPLIRKKILAREIWDEIIDAAWECAEPGLLFIDNIINNSIPDVYGDKDKSFITTSPNPCQPSWATVLTPNGISTVGEIKEGEQIWSGKQWTKVLKKWSNGIKHINDYRTTAGSFIGTENHKIVCEGKKIEVKKAKAIDISRGGLIGKNENIQDIVDGLVVGDGSVHKASNNLVYLYIGKDDKDYFKSEIKELIGRKRDSFCSFLKDIAYEVKTTINSNELPKTFDRSIPKRFLKGDGNKVASFLRGLYSANGSVVDRRITLRSTSYKLIKEVQQMLSSIGISSYYTTNKPTIVEFRNGFYECKENYDLNISTDRNKFREMIGFIQSYKNEKLDKICYEYKSVRPKETFEIRDIVYLGEHEVFDLTVEAEEHTYWSGGLLVSNCGEIPMGVDSCRLTVVNLLSFVQNKFTKKAKFDFDKFKEIVTKSQRIMDDIVDIELELINKIIDKIKSDPEPENVKQIELSLWKEFLRTCTQGRRTGLGITALGDTLAALGIRYGSKESIEMTENIYKQLALSAHHSSCILAKERGSFPLYDYSLESGSNCEYLKRIWKNSKEIHELSKKYGRRNIALTTTAPCGSISILTQTTSGIEPAFLLEYKRRKKINSDNENIKIDFIDDKGDTWQEYNVYHHEYKRWMEITGKTKVEDSPYYRATSNDVDWKMSVDIQSVAQKWISHSISKTCNVPKNATKELISEIYMRAWESGCKGFTVYRDGCRSGVLVSKDTQSNNQFTHHTAPKRPEELECDIHQTMIKGEEWIILVGLFEDKPYEIIGGLSEYVELPKNIKRAKLRKRAFKTKNNVYDLIIGTNGDKITIKNVVKLFDNPNYAAITRLISLGLRHGAKIKFIVEQLQKDKESDMFSFSKCIARVLKQYIEDGEIASSKICPGCKAEESLIYKEGCVSCLSCGFSKCS